MARTGNEFDAQALDVVIGIVQRVDLQLADVAGARIDMADSQRTSDMAQDLLLQLLPVDTQRMIGLRRCFGLDAGFQDLPDYLVHV